MADVATGRRQLRSFRLLGELGDEAENRKTWPFFAVFRNVFAIPKKIFVDPLAIFIKMSNHCHRATEGWVRIT